MAGAPKWWRRLFRQAGPMERPRQISDFGVPEELGKGLLHDGYRVAALEAARGERERCHSSWDYLRKVLKNAAEMAERTGDHELRQVVEQRWEWVANQLLVAVSDIEADVRERQGHRGLD